MKCPNCGAVLKLTGKEIIGIETGYEIRKICNECNYLFKVYGKINGKYIELTVEDHETVKTPKRTLTCRGDAKKNLRQKWRDR